MSEKLRIVLILLVVFADLFSFRQIRRGKMNLNHSLLWILISLALLLIAIFPSVAIRLSALMGIGTPVNLVFLFFAFFSIILFIYLTNVISKTDRINRRLVQKMALMEKEIREIKTTAEKGDTAAHE